MFPTSCLDVMARFVELSDSPVDVVLTGDMDLTDMLARPFMQQAGCLDAARPRHRFDRDLAL